MSQPCPIVSLQTDRGQENCFGTFYQLRRGQNQTRNVVGANCAVVPILCVLALTAIVTVLHPACAQLPRGHRVVGSRVIVNTRAHWQNWAIPAHAVDITTRGVKPHFFRGRYNLLDDLEVFSRKLPQLTRSRDDVAIANIDSTLKRDFLGQIVTQKKGGEDVPVYSYLVRPGISRVGSNPHAAANILDGEVSTYWEPDPGDSAEKWWIEVDLGRVVPVDELVLRFSDQDTGEPFRQFRVLTSSEQDPVTQSDRLTFTVAGGTDKPNLDQRILSIPFQDNVRAAPGWTGRMVETIRIVLTDTRGRRYTKISAEEWTALNGDARGDVVYFAKDSEGFEEPITKERYERLPPERQGRKDYYRRERPRLAEIEVWGWGDSISPGIVAGGGSFTFPPNSTFISSPALAFDGDFSTVYQHQIPTLKSSRGILTVDLGATFWLDAMRISATETPKCLCGQFDGYIYRSADDSREVTGELNWEPLSPPEREDNSTDRFQQILDIYDPPRRLRFLEMRIVTRVPAAKIQVGGAGIAEYQLFSSGYPAQVVLTSDLIEIPLGSSLGRLWWSGETPPDTDLEIRTRSGDTLGKVVRYFNKTTGEQVEKSAWDNFLGIWKGSDTTFVPTAGWSPWSRAYQQPGVSITSPEGRKFLQIQVKLQSEARDAAASLQSINVELGKLVGERIIAELWPTQTPTPGQVDTFEAFVQTNFIDQPAASRSPGFDELLFVMRPGKSLALLELGVSVNSQSGQAQQIFRKSGASDIFADESGTQMQVFGNGADSLWVRLPQAINTLGVGEVSKIHNRITVAGDQVPVDHEGLLLSGAFYAQLEEEEKGDIQHFRRAVDSAGDMVLAAVEQLEYGELAEEERGPIRYFRILLGDGTQFPFDADGDSLDAEGYSRLDRASRGTIVGTGPLLRIRFKATVFRNGTTLDLAVRNTAGGSDATTLWQSIAPGDATPEVDGNTLTIDLPLGTKSIENFTIAPNPFTPNADGVNDKAFIRMNVFKITTSRMVHMRIYALDGRRLFETSQMISSGLAVIPWDGTDRHRRNVPPGIYICQIELDTDSQDIALSRVITVAY